MTESTFSTEVSAVVDMPREKVGRIIGGVSQEADMPIDVLFPDSQTFTYWNFTTLLIQTALDAGLIKDASEISTIFWEMSQTPEYDYFVKRNPAVFTFTAVPSLPFDAERDTHARWGITKVDAGGRMEESSLFRRGQESEDLGRVITESRFDDDGSEWDYVVRTAKSMDVEVVPPWYFRVPREEADILFAYAAAKDVEPKPWMPEWNK